MLSFLLLSLWGRSGTVSVGVFVGGLMINDKHNYKREDVKTDKLQKWYLNYLKNKKYPLIEQEANRAAKVLTDAFERLKGVTSLSDTEREANLLKEDLVKSIITPESLIYFRDPRFKIARIVVSPTADLTVTRSVYDNPYDQAIGTLGVQGADFKYSGASGVFKKADTAVDLERTAKVTELQDIAKVSNTQFISSIKGTLTSSTDVPKVQAFEAAGQAFNAKVAGGDPVAYKKAHPTDKEVTDLESSGKEVVKAWVNEKIRLQFVRLIGDAIEQVSEKLDDPLEAALAAYHTDQEIDPTADMYEPDGTKKAPLTSPELCTQPGEKDNWETLEGEEKSKRIGLTYGFSVGYEKEMNKDHAFMGGNAFVKKDSMIIKYDLKVKERPSMFGSLESKPGYTFGLTMVAGKHFNPAFSVFGRGTFEFTKWGFTYDMATDSPKITNEKLQKQELGNWLKQAAVGVGARYNLGPSFSIEACYDFIPATKTTVREFNKLGDDDRRRGYIYTASQHRVFIKVVKLFNM